MIEDNLERLSGDERRFMLLVASLGDGGALVDLGDVIPGLDRDVLSLVLAAVAHAGGSHEQSRFESTEDGTPTSTVRLAGSTTGLRALSSELLRCTLASSQAVLEGSAP
ncbi:hypothetical protein [Arthrobacter sp. CP30]